MKPLSVTLFLLIALGVGHVHAQEAAETPVVGGPPLFSGELALEHVANQVALGPRPTATPANLQAGTLILDYLGQLGWTRAEDWHLIDFGSRAALSPEARQTLEDWNPLDIGPAVQQYLAEQVTISGPDNVVIPVRNLVASYGSGPVIILGAHYDSRLYADQDSDPERHRDPVLGANDAGSGVGVLLELARVITEHYTPNVELRFVFFDAEDNGRIQPFVSALGGSTSGYLIGSSLYAARLAAERGNIQYMLLLDMVGDGDQRFPIEGYSAQYAPDIADSIWATAADLGYGEQFVNEVRGPILDDHVPFLQQGIPAVDIIDLQYEHWHTTGDTLDKVDPASLERVGRVVQAYLEETGAITPLAP